MISDSATIIKYLDRTYPDTNALFPEGTTGFQAVFKFDTILWTSLLAPFLNIDIARVPAILSLESAKYYICTREEAF